MTSTLWNILKFNSHNTADMLNKYIKRYHDLKENYERREAKANST